MKPFAIALLPLALGACVSGGGSGGQTAVTQPTNFVQLGDLDANFQTVPANDASFEGLINGVRTANGVVPLAYNQLLDNAATAHAADMLAQNYFSHIGANGSTVGDRVTAAGYTWTFVGENIAQGQQSEQAALDGWVASAPHQANNINPNFREFGLGRAGTGSDIRWVLVFGAQ